MLDVRRMQVLRAVVTSGSLSAAATNLGYTPSAISQQISALEREAGTSLLEKVGRGVHPTPAGNLLADRAAALSDLLGTAEAELADIRSGRTGLLRLRFFQSASVALVPPAVAKFRAAHPEVRLDLRMVERKVLDEVAGGEADIAVLVVGREVPVMHGVRVIHLVDEPYRVVLPRETPVGRRGGRGPDPPVRGVLGARWPAAGAVQRVAGGSLRRGRFHSARGLRRGQPRRRAGIRRRRNRGSRCCRAWDWISCIRMWSCGRCVVRSPSGASTSAFARPSPTSRPVGPCSTPCSNPPEPRAEPGAARRYPVSRETG
ncbi:DNA-binding transcriptional LysR family regulator [Saccharopolyspora lacisalsi]|uniref:DNA-binding transcriptional LysR family regulator n=1 Tax=Halosaccharopolyspora lacisalsi TaxID=1000566 RepID=A0A839DNP6_9PSEU|nr:DNA-binding transcriptional LysR family regulator [Halosaccharopolyspora lacisalsi]